MSGETATFAINLGGNFEQSSLANAEAADKLAESMDEDLKALKAMQGALRTLQGGHMGATKEAKALKEQIAARKSVMANAQLQQLQMGLSLRRTGKDAKSSSADQVGGMKALVEQLRGSNGAMGSLLGSTQSVTAALGKAGMAGAAGLAVVAVLAVTAAIAAATVALAAYALRVVDARRSEMIRLEGLTKIPNWFGIAAGKASDMQAAIDRVSTSVSLGREKIAGYATSLYKMGLRGKNLDSALEGASIRASVLGEEMGAAFVNMAAGAVLTGQSIDGMTKRVKSQLGGLAARQMLSFSVQLEKAKENIDTLFRDVKIEGFLGGFNAITQSLSQSTATGRALKVMLETMLNPIFGSADGASNVMKRLFQGMVIGALDMTIAVLKMRKWWRETFGTIRANINWTNVAVYTGIAAFVALTVTLVTLTAVVVALGAAAAVVFGAGVLTLAAPFFLLGAAIYGAVVAFKYLVDWGKRAWADMKAIDWSAVGGAILEGITGPLGKLWEAGKKMGKAMLTGFKSVWEIASPSKVARRMVSRDIFGGAEIGAKEGGDKVGRRIGRAMFPAAEGGAGRGYAGAGIGRTQEPEQVGRGRQWLAVTVQQLIMQFTLPDGDPETQSKSAAEEFAKLLEGALLELGAT